VTTQHEPTEAQRQRALRLRHKHERQAVIFGTMIAGLLVVGLGATAVYTGLISSPFKRPFSTPAQTAAVQPVPCLPAGTRPVGYKDVAVRVLNGTDHAGLAGVVATALKQRGFAVKSTGNYPTRPLSGTVRVVAGPNGIGAAYTLAAQILDARIVLDARKDASVDLAVGTEFTTLLDPSQVPLNPDKPMISAIGCVPAAKITPQKTTAAPASPTKG